jgi:AraC-like DNA-binding protein
VQKQLILKYSIEYYPLPLADEFPVSSLDYKHEIIEEQEITSLHVHDCLEIGYCYNGAGIFIVDDKILPFSNGDICIIFKDQFHKAQSEKGKSSQWDFVNINVELLLADINVQNLLVITRILRGCTDFINILKSDQHPDITLITKDIIEEIRMAKSGYKSVIKALTWALVVKLGRLITEPSEDNNYTSKDIIRILPALEYISKNYMDPIQITDTASLCNMSLTNFRRCFNNCLKVSPLEYITKIRIQTASMFLTNTNYCILDISSRVGYSSLSSFNRHFKKIQGVCPREWRNGKKIMNQDV